VVTGKFNLAQLYERVGYNKELLSRGKFAEFLAADNRCEAAGGGGGGAGGGRGGVGC
jgi:hypothetical protein